MTVFQTNDDMSWDCEDEDLLAFIYVEHPLIDGRCVACMEEDAERYDSITNLGNSDWIYCTKHRTRCYLGLSPFDHWTDDPEEISMSRWHKWLKGYQDVAIYCPFSKDIPRPINEHVTKYALQVLLNNLKEFYQKEGAMRASQATGEPTQPAPPSNTPPSLG